MTASEKRILLVSGMTVALSIMLTVSSLDSNLGELVKIAFPGFTEVLITLVIAVIISIITAYVASRNGLDSHHTTLYFWIHPSFEELMFRLNSILIVGLAHHNFLEIIAIGLLQAFIFAVLHRRNFIFYFLFGIIWFAIANYGGIIPVIISHTTYDQVYRVLVRRQQGW